MKVLFIGLGSIGAKHAWLLHSNFNHDLFALRTFQGGYQGALPPSLTVLTSWEEVERISPEVTFITNPTHLHIETAIQAARLGSHLFVEKPLCSNLDHLPELLDLIEEKNLTSYVAYPLRHDLNVKNVKQSLNIEAIISATFVCYSFLPAWRPYNTYSGLKSTGGGAILELSHEFDLAEYLFGPIASFGVVEYGFGMRVTVDAEDWAILSATHSKGDIVSFFKLEIDNIEETCRYACIETATGPITIYPKATDRVYLRQFQYFFDNIGNPDIMNSVPEAVPLLKKLLEVRK